MIFFCSYRKDFGSKLYLFPCKNYSFLGLLFFLAYFGLWSIIHSNRARYIFSWTMHVISPRCSVINRDLPWKQWIILINFFFKFNWIFHCKQPHFTIYFPKHRDIIVFISDDRHWPSTIASQYISFRVGQRMSNDELTQ
jgi:hypothetical protein